MVHGPFGTGKSTLLVALLEFFVAAGAKRCLVAANTNVAVDCILVGLLEHGFTGVLLLCLQLTSAAHKMHCRSVGSILHMQRSALTHAAC